MSLFRRKTNDLSGRTALVTGAGAGIGREIVLALGRDGARAIACDINEDAVQETCHIAAQSGFQAVAYRVDVANEDEMRDLASQVVRQHPELDIVINNAGILPPLRPARELSPADIAAVMDVNFWGVVHGSLLFLPHLLSRPKANLANMSSLMGLAAVSYSAAYATSKFAVRGFTEALRMDLASTGVAVTVIYPGTTKTNILGNSTLADETSVSLSKAIQDMKFLATPQKVARRIVNAVAADAPRVRTGLDAVLTDVAVRIAPARYSAVIASRTEDILKKQLQKHR